MIDFSSKALQLLNSILPEKVKLHLVPFYKKLPFARPQILFHPILICNYLCSYCPYRKYYDHGKLYDSRIEPEEWIELFKKFPPSIITVSGGEPLLYKNLVPLLKGLSESGHIISQVVSNLSEGYERFVDLAKMGVRLQASFHDEYNNKEDFGSKLSFLKKKNVNVVVNFVATKENIAKHESYKDYFEKELGVAFKLDAYEDVTIEKVEKTSAKIHGENYISKRHETDNLELKSCLGGSKYFVVMPNADVYRCYHYFWYQNSAEHAKVLKTKPDNLCFGNLKDKDFKPQHARHRCSLPCKSSCDIELGDVKRI